MKIRIAIFILLLLGACDKPGIYWLDKGGVITYTPPSLVKEEPVDMVMGQSNGNGHVNYIKIPDSLAYLRELMVYNGRKAYIRNYWMAGDSDRVIKAGVNTSQAQWMMGIQPQLAYSLLRHQTTDVHIIQACGNGYPIYRFNDGMPLYEYAMGEYEKLKDRRLLEGRKVRLRSVIFIQGEADAAIYSSTYKKELQSLFYRIRLRTNEWGTKGIIVQINTKTTCAVGSAILAQKQYEVSLEPNNVLIPASPLDSLYDGCHYDVPSYGRIAKRIFDVLKVN
jgi:hypothetical protein